MIDMIKKIWCFVIPFLFLIGCNDSYYNNVDNTNDKADYNFSFDTSNYYDFESTIPESYYYQYDNTTSSHTSSTETTTEVSNEITVYITESGEKYHRVTCGSLWNSAYPTTPNEAWKMGYSPCLKCYPPFPDSFKKWSNLYE